MSDLNVEKMLASLQYRQVAPLYLLRHPLPPPHPLDGFKMLFWRETGWARWGRGDAKVGPPWTRGLKSETGRLTVILASLPLNHPLGQPPSVGEYKEKGN